MTLLPLDIVAGDMGLISGYVALSAAKGRGGPETIPMFIFGVVGPLAVVMFYWLWRIRVRKTPLAIVSISTPQVSGVTK